MAVLHRSLVSTKSRRRILGVYPFVGAGQSVQASAQNGTATGFLWMQVPAAATVHARLRRLELGPFSVVAATTTPTVPRIALAKFTFTGTPSGATIVNALRRSIAPSGDVADATAVADIRTAVTGMTVTLGALAWSVQSPAWIQSTAVGIWMPGPGGKFEPANEDDFLDIGPGEGLVLYQPDGGTASDPRRFGVTGEWDEYDSTATGGVESSVILPDDTGNTGKLSSTVKEG